MMMIIIIIIIIRRVQSKMHIGSIFENDSKELEPRKAYKYLGIETILTYTIRMRRNS